MVDTPLTQAQISLAFADNSAGGITERSLRQFNVTVTPTGQVMTGGSSITMTTTILIIAKTAGSPTTVTLPAVPIVWTQTYVIKDGKGDCSSNNITLISPTGLVDGISSFVMNIDRQAVSLVFDGTNWGIV